MKKELFSWLQILIGPISRYFAKKALINQLDSLSDRLLEDAGIPRYSIPSYVDAIYHDNKVKEIREHNYDYPCFPKHVTCDESSNC